MVFQRILQKQYFTR